MNSLVHCRINVMVSNMETAVDFYCNVLQLELVNRYGDHYAEVQCPGLMLGLHPKSDDIIMGNNLSIGFGVRDFDETITDLESKGISFKLEQDGWVRLAYFSDPDGNQLYLAENKEE